MIIIIIITVPILILSGTSSVVVSSAWNFSTHTHTHTSCHIHCSWLPPPSTSRQSPQWHWAVEMSGVKFTLTLKWRSPWATVKVSAMATAGWYRRWGGTHESPLQILHVALTASSDCSLSLSLSRSRSLSPSLSLFFFLQIAILTDLPCAGWEGKVSS